MEKLRLMCFGILSERLGNHWVEVPIDKTITVTDLRNQLHKLYPHEIKLLRSCMLTKNQRYVSTDEIITSEDELALIPPVSGG